MSIQDDVNSGASDPLADTARATPEDLLFEVPEPEAVSARNPYGEVSEFEDEWTPHGLGPCAFDDPLSAAPKAPDTVEEPASESKPAIEMRPTSSCRPPMPEDRPSGQLDAARPSTPPWAAPAAARPTTARPHAQSGMLGGARPVAAPRLQPAGGLSITIVPAIVLLFGVGAAVHSYTKYGSEVIAGVAIVLGWLGAAFCRVLLRK